MNYTPNTFKRNHGIALRRLYLWQPLEFVLFVWAIVALGGCASIQPYGPDTFVSDDAFKPLKAARKFCAARGHQVDPVLTAQQRPGIEGRFVFRCVPATVRP